MGNSRLPDFDNCRSSYNMLEELVIRTPVRALPWLEAIVGVPVWIKLECQQITGSFKFRGAINSLLRISQKQKIITASAGNHAIAMAHAATLTYHDLTICLPRSASELKRNRLANYAVKLIEYGDTLDESCAYAKSIANHSNYVFISPYNNEEVIAGHSGIIFEFLEDVPDLKHLLVPVGGGGLLASANIVATNLKSELSIIGCQPNIFQSYSSSIKSKQAEHSVFRPSLADGVLVNVEEKSITLDIKGMESNNFMFLTEEEIAAGVYSLQYFESILAEPSGTLGIAACLSKEIKNCNLKGPIGIIVTGGNLSTENLFRILTYPFEDSRIVKLLGFQSSELSSDIVLQGLADADNLKTTSFQEVGESKVKFKTALKNSFADIDKDWLDFKNYCAVEGLVIYPEEIEFREIIRSSLSKIWNAIPEFSQKDACFSERLIRLAYKTVGYLSNIFEWQSPSYLQTCYPCFQQLTSQRSSKVNYSRYNSTLVSELESQFVEVLGLHFAKQSLFVTSSGMAAYNLIESYLIRNVLKPNDVVLLPPYIYFETYEQISTIKFIKLVKSLSFEAIQYFDFVLKYHPTVLFIDAMVNTVELRLVDVSLFLSKLKEAIDYPLWIVLDGTMLSGAVNFFDLVEDNKYITIIYYESGSKYLQLGLDLTLIGIVAVPIRLSACFQRLRRNTGTILYNFAASSIPRFNRDQFSKRMKRLTDNALLLSSIIYEYDLNVLKCIDVIFPGLPTHQDYEISKAYQHLGGIVTFKFKDPGMNNRHSLNAFIEHIIIQAKKKGVAITKGVSFGFSIPRISAAASMADNTLPFLRLSVGDQGEESINSLGDVFIQSVSSYIISCSNQD